MIHNAEVRLHRVSKEEIGVMKRLQKEYLKKNKVKVFKPYSYEYKLEWREVDDLCNNNK